MDYPLEEVPDLIKRFKASYDGFSMDLTDGVKVFLDGGWVLVRQSNVAGTVKVYSQARSKEEADLCVKETINKLSNL